MHEGLTIYDEPVQISSESNTIQEKETSDDNWIPVRRKKLLWGSNFEPYCGILNEFASKVAHKKKKKRKKRKKYRERLDNDDYICSTDSTAVVLSQPQEYNIPSPMCLSMRDSPGFFAGISLQMGTNNYVGIPLNTEGNFIVVGGNGSGKSAGIAMPTLRTWHGAICATDVKGELSDFYEQLHKKELVTRPYITFDPTNPEGPCYDPFDWLLQDDPTNLTGNIWGIVLAILPTLPSVENPFWQETEKGIFAAALYYYFKCGLSFSETIAAILAQSLSSLCANLLQKDDVYIKIFIGETATMKPETLATLDRGLRNKLMLFSDDPYISHAFRGRREGANCFTWKDLDNYNIFLRIPADKIEKWAGAINMMYTQLIRHLERRPDMHSLEGAGTVQTLLLMDEFPRFGKLDMITAAMATLRSKNVNICLMIQSVAQLDKVYGGYGRRIIFDNCQFQIILRANDADTQEYICKMIGTRIKIRQSRSENTDESFDTIGYSKQCSEIRDLTVQPHELSILDDVLLLTPYGFFRTEKFKMHNEEMRSLLFAAPEEICLRANARQVFGDIELQQISTTNNISKNNKGAKIMSIDKRTENADKRIQIAEQKQLLTQRSEKEARNREDKHRNYIIGGYVSKYFPDVLLLKPGTQDENVAIFEQLEAFLYVLSTDYDLIQEIRERAAQVISENPDGKWRLPR